VGIFQDYGYYPIHVSWYNSTHAGLAKIILNVYEYYPPPDFPYLLVVLLSIAGISGVIIIIALRFLKKRKLSTIINKE
jgi:hypothetical protein